MANTRDNKRLIIGVHYEPSGLDPHIGAAELALQMTNGVFDTLVNKTPEGDYLPGLAEEFEVSGDGCVYTFRLRKGVNFHDGTALDAEAVKFSFDRARDPANHSQLAGGMLGPYRETRVIGEHALEVHLDQPYALLLDALSQGWLAPVSPRAVAAAGTGFARHPVGTGPFVFEHWRRGEDILLRRNPHYAWAPPLVHNRGCVHLQELQFVFLPDHAARTAALETGAVDAIFYVPPADIARLRANPALQVHTWPIRGVPVCMMMNTARAPTCELQVRRAINFAVDQDELVREVFRGEFARAYGPVSQFTLGYEPAVERYYPHDIAQAKHLLEQSGWVDQDGDGIREKNGEKLALEFYALPVNFYPQFGAIIARQLRRVGIQVDVRLVDPVPWIKAGMRGDHHLIPQGKYASSSQLLSFVYHSRNSGANGYGWSKRSAKHRPGLDELLERAERTLPVAEFVPLFQQVQSIVMDEALVAPLHCNTNIVACRGDIEGWRFDAIGAYPLVHDMRFVQRGAQ